MFWYAKRKLNWRQIPSIKWQTLKEMLIIKVHKTNLLPVFYVSEWTAYWFLQEIQGFSYFRGVGGKRSSLKSRTIPVISFNHQYDKIQSIIIIKIFMKLMFDNICWNALILYWQCLALLGHWYLWSFTNSLWHVQSINCSTLFPDFRRNSVARKWVLCSA